MKSLVLLFLLFFNSFGMQKETTIAQESFIENPKQLLDAISNNAIRIGIGEMNSYYIFVDPMCPYSRKFMKMITKEKLPSLATSYYIFLYRLPMFKSDKLIQYIYESSDAKQALLDVMVEEKTVDLEDFQSDNSKLKIIQDIATVGKELKMKKRPYIMLFEQNSKYCQVSEGNASCMEEFDFD